MATLAFNELIETLFRLTHFSSVLHFIQKPVNLFVVQIKWLVSTWNAALDWAEMFKKENQEEAILALTSLDAPSIF